MKVAQKLAAVARMPRAERRRKIKQASYDRLRKLGDIVVFHSVGRLMNGNWRLPYIIGHRPDFHCDANVVRGYRTLFDAWVRGNTRNNCGDMARFYALYQNVTHVLDENVPGDIVELGVYKGNSAAILSALGRERGRRTYLFDTFAGFDARDLHGPDAGRAVQFGDTALETVQELVGTRMVTYVKGHFPESTAQIALPAEIAVAHIDCDLYEPMKAGLEHFYPRVAGGGVLILHDYSSGQWPGATRAIDEFFAYLPERPVLLPDKSGTAIVRKVRRC
jgi:hypothetical protein